MYIFIHTPPTLSSWLRAVFCSLLESIPLLSNDYLKNNLQHFRMAKSPEFVYLYYSPQVYPFVTSYLPFSKKPLFSYVTYISILP